MFFTKSNPPRWREKILLLSAVLTGTFASAANVNWDGSESSAWEEGANWDTGAVPQDTDYVYISSGDVDFTNSSGTSSSLRGFRQTGGSLNVTGGELEVANLASAYSTFDSTVSQSGGFFRVNAVQIGSERRETGSFSLSGGELNINRGVNGHSLYIGSNRNSSVAGTGTFEISGGSLTTRTSVKLGDAATVGTGSFTVLGSNSSRIGIGASTGDQDATWEQNDGSTLNLGIDSGGVTTIVIHDSDSATTGTSAVFENGALLNVGYYTITQGGGTWTAMEVENGDITDKGLAFAPGVDTSIWSFAIDNSGSNGRLLITAVGDPIGLPLIIGSTPQQRMRYGMDYERLWYWSSNLNSGERDDIARWSAVDTDIDFVRVAINGGYELTEKGFDLSAYTRKIIPLMQEMRDANPNLKFFASPRPLDEAEDGVRWQPYPRWITGDTSNNGNFDFDWENCAEYLVRYLLLMKSYGFQISFLDITNEWQSNVGGGRLTQDDMDNIHGYLNVTYMADPWPHPELDSSLLLTPGDIPRIVGPSSWNYSQGTSWIKNLDSGDREALSIASSHNTDRGGDAQSFADAVTDTLGTDTEIWNTEVHGWKSTSSENETTSFYYYIECIRAGFGGLNGWLAIGTKNQGHAYILNPSGTPSRNVKYHIFQKLSSTSNYGHALDIIEEPDQFRPPLDSNDDDIPRNIAAFIKGNLMTVWVVNENSSAVPLVVTPSGRAIAASAVRRTRWTDPSDVEGFETYEAVISSTSFASTIPGESVCCFEIVLDTEEFANNRIEAEDYSHQWGIGTESTDDAGGGENVCHTNDGDWMRYGAVALAENSKLSLRLARPSGRADSKIQIREGSSDGNLLGEVSVPVTNGWQTFQTVETTLDVDAGIYNLYLGFVEDSNTPSNGFLANFNWFTVNEEGAPSVTGLTATASGDTQIDLGWDALDGASSYQVKRSTSANGPFTSIASNLTETSFSDLGLAPVTTYHYVVAGIVNGEASPESESASATTLAEPIVAEDLVISTFEFGYDELNRGQLTFTIEKTGLGQSYQVHSSGNIETGDWTPVGPVYQGTGGLLDLKVLFDHSDSTSEREFFRVVVWIE